MNGRRIKTNPKLWKMCMGTLFWNGVTTFTSATNILRAVYFRCGGRQCTQNGGGDTNASMSNSLHV